MAWPAIAETLRIAQWNWRDASIRSRDATEIELAVDLVEHVQPDILAIEELNDAWVVQRLVEGLNGRGYSYSGLTSEKVGYGGAAEHYAFVWNIKRVRQLDAIFMDDPDNYISREPWLAAFAAGDHVFSVFVFHASYDKEQRRFEIAVVSLFFAGVEQGLNDIQLVLCGDFNEPAYISEFDPMREVATPAIPITDTTVWKKFSPYDNIWVDNDLAFENPAVFKHDDEWFGGDNDAASLHLSDHYIVWADVEWEETGVNDWEVY